MDRPAKQQQLHLGQHLDINRRSPSVQRFDDHLRARVVGQQQAIDAVLDGFSRLVANIRDPERPLLTLMFLGPTGVGKTETVKSLAETVFGDRKAFIRINCQEFNNEGSVAKLFGAPPGYVGSDVDPMLSQERLDGFHKQALSDKRGVFADGKGRIAKLFPQDRDDYLSIICFDEVEKAHPTVWNALLGLMEDGHVTLGNNKTVDCTRSIIIMTTNVGAEEMSATLQRNQVGFDTQHDDDSVDRDLTSQAVSAAKEHFPYEFFNRFDEVICFRSLRRDDLETILDGMLNNLYNRLISAHLPIILHPSTELRSFILEHGFDPQFGARPLRRSLDQHLVSPLARLIASEQIQAGQVIAVDLHDGEPRFSIEPPDQNSSSLVI